MQLQRSKPRPDDLRWYAESLIVIVFSSVGDADSDFG